MLNYTPENLTSIFNPDNSGMLLLPSIMSQSFLDEFNDFLNKNNENFEIKREKYIENNQKVFLIYRGPFDTSKTSIPLIDSVIETYVLLRTKALENSDFNTGNILEIKLIKYPESDLGVGLHRDLSSNINLIAFFNLKGAVTIDICDNKQRENEINLELSAGTVNIMRAPRNDSEKHLRPLHGIGRVDNERIVLVIREIDEKLEEETNSGNWRGF